MIPDYLPQLAIGTHPTGTGRACIMNFISYLSGDDKITDEPLCVDKQVAYVMAWVNDNICWHNATEQPVVTYSVLIPNMLPPAPDGWTVKFGGHVEETVTSSVLEQNRQLCPSCSHAVLMLGQRCMGTAELLHPIDHLRAALWAINAIDVMDPGYLDVRSRHVVDLLVKHCAVPDDITSHLVEKWQKEMLGLPSSVDSALDAAAYMLEAEYGNCADASASAVMQCFDCLLDETGDPTHVAFDPDARAEAIQVFAEAYLDEIHRLAGVNLDREFTEADYRLVREMAKI